MLTSTNSQLPQRTHLLDPRPHQGHRHFCQFPPLSLAEKDDNLRSSPMIVLRRIGIRHSIGDAPWQADDAEGPLIIE